MADSEVAFVSERTFTQPQFVQWLSQLPFSDDNAYELIEGRVVMTPPTGWPWSRVEARLAFVLTQAVEPAGLGIVFGAACGYELATGHTVTPDASVVLAERWHASPPRAEGFLRLVPNLAAEALSPRSRGRDSVTKRRLYERAGIDEYWLVDQEQLTITVLHLQADGIYDAGDVFRPGEPIRSRVLPALTAVVDDVLLVSE